MKVTSLFVTLYIYCPIVVRAFKISLCGFGIHNNCSYYILALLYTWIFVDQLLLIYPPPLFILKSLSYLYFLCGQIGAVPE